MQHKMRLMMIVCEYLKPVGDFEVDLVDALHSVVERPRGLGGLEAGLRT